MKMNLILAAILLPACVGSGAVVFSQPHTGSGSWYQSAISGNDYDQQTWDRFRCTNAAAITEIHWRGGYLYGGTYSGRATNWTVSVYGDILNGYQPDIVNPPLVTYTIAGNAGETNAGTFGGSSMFDYSYILPSPFQAGSNQFYWILIQANQTGVPEWAIAFGSGTHGGCFRRTAGVGGDLRYYMASGDTAFMLVGSDAPSVSITAAASPTGAGTIVGAGDYPLGSSASLRATPAAGYGFLKWTQNGAQVSTASTYNFIATSNRTLVANFVPAYAIGANANPTYAGNVSGAGTYNSNASVTVTAANVSGFQFVNWTEFGAPVSALRSYTFAATASRTLTANYAVLPQTATFDFDPGDPPVFTHGAMPASQSNRGQTAYFTAGNGSWSIQNTIYGWVSPLFSGNFLYPSTWWSTFSMQFNPPVTNLSFKFVTSDLTTAGDVPMIVRATAYTNSMASPAVGASTAQGAQWVNGPYPDGTLTLGTATPFDFVKIDFPPGQPNTISGLLFVDNIVTQRPLPAPSTFSIATSVFPDFAGTTTGDGAYSPGETVTVTATTNAGFAFLSWIEAGVPISASRSYTFTAGKDRVLYASFVPLYSVTATASPANGGSISGTGTFTNGAPITLTTTPANGFYFLGWTEEGVPASTSASYGFALTSDRVLVANFAPGWTVTTSSLPTAGGTTSGAGGYVDGATATVTAIPNAGYQFLGWKQGGTVVSTTPSHTFVVTSNRNLTATFVRTYTVTTVASPPPGGAVSGEGIYTNGASVTVRAFANPGFVFTNWTENATIVSAATNYTFAASANRTLTANFVPTTSSAVVNLSASPAHAGLVSGAGTYNLGETATVTATPNALFAFASWTENGSLLGTNEIYTFTVWSNRTLVASFTDTFPPPVAIGGTFYQLTNHSLAINIADLIYNDYDADGDPVTFVSVSSNTSNGLPITTNLTQVLIPSNSVPDRFTYVITDGNGGYATGTAIVAIVEAPLSRAISVDFTFPGGLWVTFSGVPWYFYTSERATNVTFSGAVQAFPVQAGPDGAIYVWDDFSDMGGFSPPEAYYRLRFGP